MKKLLCFSFCILWVHFVFAQNSGIRNQTKVEQKPVMLPVKANHKWGAIDLQGKIILPTVFDYIGEFSKMGLSVAQKNKKLGVIDKQGQIIIPFQYNNLHFLGDSLIAVLQEKYWGVFDWKGEQIVPFKADKISVLSGGRFGMAAYKKVLLIAQNEKIGLLSYTGKMLIEPKLEDVYLFENDLIITIQDNRKGLANFDGKILLPNAYDNFKIADKYPFIWTYKNKQKGALDLQGNLLLEAEFDEIDITEINKKRYFEIKKGNLKGLYTIEGKEILPAQFQEILPQKNGSFIVQQNGKQGIYSNEGKELLATAFTQIKAVNNNYFQIFQDNLVGIYALDVQKIIIPINYYMIETFNSDNLDTDYFMVHRNGKVGLLDNTGKVIIQANEYESIAFDPAGTFFVKKDNLWGISGARGSLKPQFEFISNFKRGLAMTKNEGFYGLINIRGQILAGTRYNQLRMVGTTARLYAPNGTVESLTFDNQGNLVDRMEVKNLKTLSIKRTSNPMDDVKIEDNWTFDTTNVSRSRNINIFTDTTASNNAQANFKRNLQLSPLLSHLTLTANRVKVYDQQIRDSVRITLYDLYNNNINKNIIYQAREISDILADFERGNLARQNAQYISQEGQILKSVSYWDARKKIEKKGLIFHATPFGKGGLSLFNVLGVPSAYNIKVIANKNQVKGGLWGIVRRDGQIISQAQYQDITPFDEQGFAKIKRLGKWGIMDSTGKEIIKPELDSIGYLENTDNQYFTLIKRQTKYGYLDTTAQVQIPFQFKKAFPFKNDRAIVQYWNNRFGLIDKTGKSIEDSSFQQVRDFSEGRAAVKPNRYWGFIDENGNEIIHDTFALVGDFHEGRAWVKIIGKKGFAYIDAEGNVVIDKSFKEVSDFQQGVAVVSSFEKEGRGLIDLQGNWIVEPKYYQIQTFDEQGFAKFRKSNESIEIGLIDTKGKEVLPAKYERISSWTDAYAIIQKNGQEAFVDTTGKQIGGFYEDLKYFHLGMAAVKKNKHWGYIDTTGKEIVKPLYDNISGFYKGYARASENGKYFYINLAEERFKEIADTLDWYDSYSFDNLQPVFEGLRAFQRKNLWGFTDSLAQKTIVSPRYKTVTPFFNGYAKVSNNKGNTFYINKSGQAQADKNGSILKTPPKGIWWMDRNRPYFTVVYKNGRYGFSTGFGFQISKPIYSSVSEIQEDMMCVAVTDLRGIADLQGNQILAPEYEQVMYCGAGIFRIEKDGLIGYWHKTDGWIWNLQR